MENTNVEPSRHEPNAQIDHKPLISKDAAEPQANRALRGKKLKNKHLAH